MSEPCPWPPMPRLVCRGHVFPRSGVFVAASRPDPDVLDPWVDVHAAHDPTLRDRVEETWK